MLVPVEPVLPAEPEEPVEPVELEEPVAPAALWSLLVELVEPVLPEVLDGVVLALPEVPLLMLPLVVDVSVEVELASELLRVASRLQPAKPSARAARPDTSVIFN